MKQKIIKRFSVAMLSIFIFGAAVFVIANAANIPAFSDSDQDGLSDDEEKAYGTDFSDRDSDDDGYSDGTEVKSGYDPLKPAPGDKMIVGNPKASEARSNDSKKGLTEEFAGDFRQFVESKDKQTITVDDMDAFVTEKMADKIGDPITKDTLPQADISKIVIKKQSYDGMDEKSKLEQEKKDWETYQKDVFSIFVANMPGQVSTEDDLDAFYREFESKLASLASTNPGYQYFRNIAVNLRDFVSQAEQMEVPESALSLHIGLLRISKGFLALKDPTLPAIEDPLTKFIILYRANSLKDITAEFFNNDVAEYQKRFDRLK